MKNSKVGRLGRVIGASVMLAAGYLGAEEPLWWTATNECVNGNCPAPQSEPSGFLPPGRLTIGANYWASHAATDMWIKWDAAQVDRDFATLAANGFKLLRVFPNWRDFQPIVACTLNGGNWDKINETRMFLDEQPLPNTPAGFAGMDERMLAHFEEFCDLAEKHGIQLLVSLLTGQMTFRNYIPPALVNRDLYADPYALKWEGRFIDCFVSRLKAKKAIVAWESGNEARILAKCENEHQAEFWQRYIHNCIRQADPSRPVVGVDGLNLTSVPNWPTRVNAYLSDYTTTHPYGFWGNSYLDDARELRHCTFATALTWALERAGGKPAFCEEHGVRRQEQISPDHVADYMRSLLWNLWAYNGKAMLWWCAFDQTGQTIAPYNWRQPCVELGIFKRDRTPYPGVKSVHDFAALQANLPFRALPKPRPDVLFLCPDGDLVHSTFMLCQQAGLVPDYQDPEDPLRDARRYFLPAANGRAFLTIENWTALKEKVRNGATLYLSWSDTFLDSIEEVCGLVIDKREAQGGLAECTFKDFKLSVSYPVDVTFKPLTAETLATDQKGRGVFFKNKYGKGTVYTFAYPFERSFYKRPGAYARQPAWKLYSLMCPTWRVFTFDTPQPDLSVVEHCFGNGRCAITVVNNSATPVSVTPRFKPGWGVVKTLTDNADLVRFAEGRLELGPNSGILLMTQKEKKQ